MSQKDEDDDRVRQAQAIAAMAREIKETIVMERERQRVFAKFQFIRFQALLAAGLTGPQALQLVRW
jgi:hypothetical protein